MIEVMSENEMKAFGEAIGALLNGGEIIELIGDVGSGKTTLTKGLAVGLGINEYIQSPSFTINRVYSGRDDIVLAHYDFYRLNDAGIMANELREAVSDSHTVTVIEWAEVVKGVLPIDRLSIEIIASTETSRRLVCNSGGDVSNKILEKISV